MGETGFKNNPDEMEQLGVKTCSESGNYAAGIDSIKNTKNNLMGIWHGEASEEFGNTVDKQVKTLTDLEDVLNKMGEAIQKGAQTFRSNEEDQVKKAQGLVDETRVGF